MPEGDTIFRSAVRLRPELDGSRVVNANDNGRFACASELMGARFDHVEAKGKHLLMHLDDGRVLHSHMGMTGSWHIYQLGEPWRKSPRAAALSMDVCTPTERKSTVVCFSPKTLELLTATRFRRHPYLSRLGPDLMLNVDRKQVLGRFRVHNLAPIGVAIMNQTIVCGVGNVYKSEVLFLTGQNPFTAVRDLADDSILEIVDLAQNLMQKNVAGHARQTRLSADGQRLWVYGRSGQPCFKCGETVEITRQGDLGRSTYWCRNCQPA